MKKYSLIDDIHRTGKELIRAVKWRALCNASQQQLINIIEKQIADLCSEIEAQYQLAKTDHESGVLPNLQFRRFINELKLLFEHRYYKHYSQSLIQLKNKIESNTISEILQIG